MNIRSLKSMAVLVVVALGLVLSACSGASEYRMESGQRTAGAEGIVEVTSDKNGNRVVSLSVAHLPRPGQLDESAATYVVWVSPDGTNYNYNVGQLRLADDRTGQVSFTTPFPSFAMVVTAEAHSTVLAPSDQVVLKREVGSSR
ncbi:hypothetical protein DL240_16575 [Lujinxingia litoralis]|uniref:Anti-sigma factor n=1 Tax=Lujinxingia litoralis TaxID=2211119 RepID=A0A328C2B5_9DELT|nr:hypothetical protein [Lujinxingia litoralis]RAL20419.1 hypothetical protein DL240_16575 [Lujinxingia litoralis]